MVGRVRAGRDGQRVLRALSGHNLHLFLVLQRQRSTLLTGQRQSVELHLCLARRLQLELSVVALARQSQRQFVFHVLALDLYFGAVHGHRHAVFHRLCHLCLRSIIADGDILRVTHAAHHEGQHP